MAIFGESCSLALVEISAGGNKLWEQRGRVNRAAPRRNFVLLCVVFASLSCAGSQHFAKTNCTCSEEVPRAGRKEEPTARHRQVG